MYVLCMAGIFVHKLSMILCHQSCTQNSNSFICYVSGALGLGLELLKIIFLSCRSSNQLGKIEAIVTKSEKWKSGAGHDGRSRFQRDKNLKFV